LLYLGTSPCDPNVADMLNHRRIGLMCQPKSNAPKAGWVWAADNGCFSDKWDETTWLEWLNKDHPRAGCLFAVVPDVVANHELTLARFFMYASKVRDARFPVAFVAQDGAESGGLPWGLIDCLFIGGSTEWKMSEHAYTLAAEARKRGKWVHVGRVNSWSRFSAWAAHADSADGTFLAFGPSVNSIKVASWIDQHWTRPSLFAVAALEEKP
jgi:hypothetical protein